MSNFPIPRSAAQDQCKHRLSIAVSAIVVVGVFALGNATVDTTIKGLLFFAVLAGYIVFLTINQRVHPSLQPDDLSPDETEERLSVLEDAVAYFGSSLEVSEIFRLVAARMKDLVSFDAALLLSVDTGSDNLSRVCWEGESLAQTDNFEVEFGASLAAVCAASGAVRQSSSSGSNAETGIGGSGSRFCSTAAFPLKQAGEVVAVVQLFSTDPNHLGQWSVPMLEAIAARVAPIAGRSKAAELNTAAALTDRLTNLPNERAFYTVLETQVAEAHRNRNERTVSILAIDIKYFSDVNERFGHTSGDRLLSFVAGELKRQLRQMDLLTRSVDDEFLVTLPTATESVVSEVVERLKAAFAGLRFDIDSEQSITVPLNFGQATFGIDGEDASKLLAVARSRKDGSKADLTSKVIWFPRDSIR
ncbi:MAG: GGDEF domain-containing protein [Chloracidobacterium sp.]|nr:GGDEF domain-containing protein [Chloracidobacterium sp.]MCO5334845.1 sensor domain-containing diguanylate cyclase [Pyrinomonadaceae bacterium]